MTTAVLLVLLGALSRLLPHPPNFVAMGALALYAGARLPRRHALWIPLAAMALSDLLIDFGTGRSLVGPVRLSVYGSFAAIVLLGRLAASDARAGRLAGLSAAGSVLFFLVTNFANWAEFTTYPPTAQGLLACYIAGLPFFWRTLTADLLGTAVLFGLDALARRSRPIRGAAAGSAALLAVVLLSGRLEAQTPPQPTPTASESIVVTATAVPAEETTVGAATTVITRAEIERRGLKSVVDVLRSVPGLDVVQSGSEGSITSVFLRGANSNDTLLLIDGARMNSPYFAGYDFSTLTVENIERVEVARGPFSALYGSDAMGGVIQIVTRGVGQGLAGRASFEAGNVGQVEGDLFATYGAGPWGMTASFRDGRLDGDRRNSDWHQTSGGLRLEGRFASVVAGIEAGLTQGEAGVPGPIGGETPHARAPWWEERLALPISWKPAEGHEVTALVAHVISKPDFEDPDSFFSSSTRTASLQARVGDAWTSGDNRLAGFASYDRGTVDSKSNFGVDLDGQHTTIWALGAEDSLKLPSGFIVTAGLRYDDHSQFGSAWSPRGSLSWLSADGLWKVRASGGTGFRAPTVGELYFPFVGNPNLKPERSTSYEIGGERYLGKGRVEASFFWNDFRDLIVYDFSQGQDFNVGRARTRGVEVAWKQEVIQGVFLDTGYTYLDPVDRDTGLPLIRRPHHRGYLAASVVVWGLTVAPRLTVVGDRPDNDALTGVRVEKPSYLRIDCALRYQLGPVAPYVRLLNLTDHLYEEADGYPAARFRVAAGLEARF